MYPLPPAEPAATQDSRTTRDMNTHRIIALLACVISLTFSAIAATSEDAAKKATISVSLYNTPVPHVLKYIEDLSGVKVYYTAPQKDEVISLGLKSVPVSEAFKFVAASANLTVTYKDDGAHFAPKE